ncbi:hypothetical protein D9611_011712 [Ephemerocybe angulata]|uniref:Uncharacterized protein n=1 Tax=Ephemerocybe angulata TaxID=980116 RepID=A0A8H5C511_9AGAR|nr:hypothetical protein D9611_011712 [Tulosesus angulatus]
MPGSVRSGVHTKLTPPTSTTGLNRGPPSSSHRPPTCLKQLQVAFQPLMSATPILPTQHDVSFNTPRPPTTADPKSAAAHLAPRRPCSMTAPGTFIASVTRIDRIALPTPRPPPPTPTPSTPTAHVSSTPRASPQPHADYPPKPLTSPAISRATQPDSSPCSERHTPPMLIAPAYQITSLIPPIHLSAVFDAGPTTALDFWPPSNLLKCSATPSPLSSRLDTTAEPKSAATHMVPRRQRSNDSTGHLH